MTENKRLHTALIGSSAAHKKCSMHEFQKLNLTTGQPKVLSILYQNEGYLQKELALRSHVEPATMTSILNKMAEKGLIYKKTVSVSGGKRAYAIYLTEEGREMATKVIKIVDDMENISFKGFHDYEKQLLIDLLNRIQTNLEENI
ncbi:MarR family transcriptional regulator [Mobilitalea sibirica]|uniref:MarR family transcriptional regulator n=1 Tax=Mobilitalea sibirica TaxID=1462919 RepID=A0A8J7H565_9FIRM|nr:MarR family transcriptional regulator [Mobilitalea sibirica]MBH1939931.1 MarR family transcriptional regulator [Mobilitalea sibirica]